MDASLQFSLLVLAGEYKKDALQVGATHEAF